jgi:hypothetical protein
MTSSLININLSLSKELLELTEKQRQLKLAEILVRLSTAIATRFFSIIWRFLLMLSSSRTRLRLLQGLSRNLTVVASWNGTFEKGKLTYAEPGHREYRSYDLTDTLVVSMSGEATVRFLNSQARIN